MPGLMLAGRDALGFLALLALVVVLAPFFWLALLVGALALLAGLVRWLWAQRCSTSAERTLPDSCPRCGTAMGGVMLICPFCGETAAPGRRAA